MHDVGPAVARQDGGWSPHAMPSRYSDEEQAVRERFARIAPTLDERGRRLFAANEALAFGFGGAEAVARATGLSKETIYRGIQELNDLERLAPPEGRQRRPGGDPKRLTERDPGLLPALNALLEPRCSPTPHEPDRLSYGGP